MRIDLRKPAELPIIILALFSLQFSGCKQGESQSTAGGQMPPQPVQVLELRPRDLPISFEYVGRLEASREIEIRPRITGLIEERLFDEGGEVISGQTLFRLDAAPFAAGKRAAEAALAEARARLSQTERDVRRLTPLARDQAVSQQSLDDALSARDLARAAVAVAEAELLKAQLELDYTNVTAPIAGRIGRALQVEGALVSPTSGPLVYLAQIDPLFVRFSISENDKLAIEQQLAEGSLEMPPAEQRQISIRMADGTSYPISGRVDFTDYRSDPQTGAFASRATLPNPDARLRPGQFVRVTVEGGVLPNALAVPQRAVQEDARGKFVYVVGQDDQGKSIALNRAVEVGQWVEQGSAEGKERLWIIRSGLTAGDKVVIDGTARIFYPGMAIDPQPAGAGSPEPAAAAPTAKHGAS
ncbi:MAG: efflux RND transporter periplasmic adaptor subunit [Chromatiales bacterium]